VNQFHNFVEFPNMVTNASFHRGCDSERLMYSAEVIVHEVKRQRVFMILNFLRERICQPREASHVHPHGEVLPFDVASRNVIPVGFSNNRGCNRADTLRRAVSSLCALRFVPVQFDQHRVVNLSSKSQVHGSQVSAMAVCGQLNAIGETRSEVGHEVLRVPSIAPTHSPARNNLGVSAVCRPSLIATVTELAAQIGRNILFLRVAERPNFIALDSLTRQVAQGLVLIFRACLSNLRQQFNNGVLCNARHSHRGANRIALNKSGNHCRLAFNWEVVHA